MSFDAAALYRLLPGFYRLRDQEAETPPGPDGLPQSPLKALLSAFAAEIAGLEENLAQLYDDQFIETCAEWVIPYIGDLIGYRKLYGLAPRISSPRAEVANTIAFRRRKGTVLVLEQLAQDVTGWSARAAEFFQDLAATQSLKHIRPDRGGLADLRAVEALERLGGPFDSLAHGVDVRRIATGHGRFNLPNVGLFLWRLASRKLEKSPAVRVDGQRFLFHPLGLSAPLFARARIEPDLTALARFEDMPSPLGRRALEARLDQAFYGSEASFSVQVDGADVVPAGTEPSAVLCVCDLSDILDSGGTVIGWAHVPAPGGRIAVDPALGRLAFPSDQGSKQVTVTFHYPSPLELGGGPYPRTATFAAFPAGPAAPRLLKVPGDAPTVAAALALLGSADGTVEIADNGRYAETPAVAAAAGQRIEIRAAEGKRPHLALGGDWILDGGAGSRLAVNGLLVSGGGLHVTGSPLEFALRHCTLVPGLSLDPDGSPHQPHAPSLKVDAPAAGTDQTARLEIDHCVLGPVRIPDQGWEALFADSLIDSPDRDPATRVSALAADDAGALPAPPLSLERCTVWGPVRARQIDLASDCIFNDTVLADRRQAGCLRFSYAPPGSSLPRRFQCQPDTAVRKEWDRLAALQPGTPLTAAQKQAARDSVENRLKPDFDDTRFGAAAYGQLSQACAPEIKAGASDQSEMGAYHDVYQPQKETNLRVRLEEYLRFSLEAGIIYAT
jgi:hypothetical protein